MTSRRTWLLAAALSAPLCMGVSDCSDAVVGDKKVCEYDGKVYAHGDDFPSEDHCNTCTCGVDGEVSCTLLGCGGTCDYEGKTYAESERFPAADGCNTCTCTSTGVACTEEGCGDGGKSCSFEGKTYAHGAGVPSGDCNSCGCNDGDVQCTLIACFDGCESGGMFYDLNQTFKHDCATCVCTEDGVACDDVVCPVEPGCSLGNATFAPGSDVICADGCTNCHCEQPIDPEATPAWAEASGLTGCPPLPQIQVCAAPTSDQNLEVTPLYLSGDALALKIQTGGGCEEHPMRLCTDGSFLESNPVQLKLWVVDDGKPDLCDAIITEQLVFDLSPLQKLYRDGYPNSAGAIILTGDGNGMLYTF
jgi:hypothetical protein